MAGVIERSFGPCAEAMGAGRIGCKTVDGIEPGIASRGTERRGRVVVEVNHGVEDTMTMTKRESEKVSLRRNTHRSGRREEALIFHREREVSLRASGKVTNSLLELVGGILQGLGLLHADGSLQARYLCHAFAGGASFYPVSQLAFAAAPGTKPTGSMAGGLHQIRAAYAG